MVKGCFLAGVTFLTLMVTAEVGACVVSRSGYMPICGGITIPPETDVYLVENDRNENSSNVLLGPKGYSAVHQQIEIGEVKRPITLIISHYKAGVINITGNVDQVAKVVAMGASSLGWDHVAVTGVPAQKVTFLPVIAQNTELETDCRPPPKSCVPEQYFEIEDNSLLSGYPVDPALLLNHEVRRIESYKGERVFIPPTGQSRVTEEVEDNFTFDWQGEMARYKANTTDVKIFEEEQLLSPTNIELDANLPSWAGIDYLLQKKMIRPAGSYGNDGDLQQFSEKFNAKYHSRFDPDFTFEPVIDFVLSPYFRGPLPRDLRHSNGRAVYFLRSDSYGVDIRDGDRGEYCFYNKNDPLYQSEQSDRGIQEIEDREKYCRPHHLRSIYYSSDDNAIKLARLQLEAAVGLRSHEQWQTELCPLVDIPKEAEVVVLATENGQRGTKVSFEHCGIERSKKYQGKDFEGRVVNDGLDQCAPGTVEVKVDREGPLFLFLKAHSAVQWNLDVSESSNISGIVAIGDQRQSLKGIPKESSFNQYTTRDHSLPDKCRNGLLDHSPIAGGPAILLYEQMIEKISGRKIDILINKGISPEPADQTPEMVESYTKFIVQ